MSWTMDRHQNAPNLCADGFSVVKRRTDRKPSGSHELATALLPVEGTCISPWAQKTRGIEEHREILPHLSSRASTRTYRHLEAASAG